MSDRDHSPETVEERLRLLESVLDAIPDIIGIQDRSHRVLRYNAAGYRFVGIEPHELANRRCYELIGQRAECEPCATSEVYRTRRPARIEKRLADRDRWLEVRAYPVFDERGEVERVIEHLRDITDRVRAEERSRRHIADLDLLARSAMAFAKMGPEDDVYRIIGERVREIVGDRTIVAVSELAPGGAFCPRAVLGFGDHLERAARLIGRRPEQLTASFPPDVERAMSTGRAHEVDGGAFALARRALPAPLARTVCEALGLAGAWVVGFAKGEVVHGGITIVQRRGAEPIRRETLEAFVGQAAVTLERRRAVERNEELNAQLFQAQKMEAVGRLAGGVAHDFNNLLTGITGNLGLALHDLDGRHPVRELLNEAADAAARAGELSRRLLTFSRRRTIARRAASLDEILTDMQRMLVRLLGEDVELVTRLAGDLPPIRVDPSQIEQAVVNLAVNARDAMTNGGRIEISTRAVELGPADCENRPGIEPGRHVLLTVADDGHGMDEATRQRAFEPFFTTKPEGRGTGLGLAIVYGAVQQNEGHVELRSTPDEGTAFFVLFPAAEGAASPVAPAGGDPSMPRGKETILLAEDEDTVRSLLARVLERLGYRVLAAADGPAAVDLADAAPAGSVDLVLTDVVMPGMNGPELVERALRRHPRARVVYVSGYTDADLDAALRRQRAVFVPKPFSPLDISRRIREVLDDQEEPKR